MKFYIYIFLLIFYNQSQAIWFGEPTQKWPQVVKVTIFSNDHRSQTCTATLVNESILMAAHCLYEGEVEKIDIYDSKNKKNIKIYSEHFKVFVNQGYLDCYINCSLYDVGYIKFDKNSVINIDVSREEKISPSYICPKKNDQITIVGFGATEAKESNLNIKRQGETFVSHVDVRGWSLSPILIQSFPMFIDGKLNKSSPITDVGDSGGPMIYQGAIVGIASKTFYDDRELNLVGPYKAKYAPLCLPNNQNFLKNL